jgi:hypothetical protein
MIKEIIAGVVVSIWGLVALLKPAAAMKISIVFCHFKPNLGIVIFYRIMGIALPFLYFSGLYAEHHP